MRKFEFSKSIFVNNILEFRYIVFLCLIIFGGFYLFLNADNAKAVAVTWVGGSTGTWETPTNWSTGIVPTKDDSVTIACVGTTSRIVTVSLGQVANFSSLSIGGQMMCITTLILEGDIGNGTNITIGLRGYLTQKNKSVQNISGDLIIQNGGYLNHTANLTDFLYNVNIIANNITVNNGGSIYVKGAGYASETGPGHGNYDQNYGSGAGHGGDGGGSDSAGGGYTWSSISGKAYGDSNNPQTIGSGGGSTWSTSGGNGGGLIILEAKNNFINNGVVNADGNGGSGSGSGYGGGGGSGGGINITAKHFTNTTVSFTANGGSGGSMTVSPYSTIGAGGGGGRILIKIETYNNTGGIYVYGGNCFNIYGKGLNGTFLRNTTIPNYLPTIATPSFVFPNDGSGRLGITALVTDLDNDVVKLKIQYETGSCNYNGDENIASVIDVAGSSGMPIITTNNYRIQNIFSLPGNLVSFKWDAKNDIPEWYLLFVFYSQ